MPFLSLKNISKSYGAIVAVNDLSLDIERGEFFGLLGASGCGKTTTLRMIAGLETPDAGRLEFGGVDITRLPSERRGFGMVFQNYALFPHLNVFENIAFGLRARHRPRAEIAERVTNALALVRLPGYERRRVVELSGGQQQRIAIARAIAIEPALLLFDEPLSNLDITLREETRSELRELVARLNLTAVYVTHDQEEAFALCDRISVMSEGRIMQTACPRELYERPQFAAVARFLGRNNLIEAVSLNESAGEFAQFQTKQGGHVLHVPVEANKYLHKESVMLAIRPEHVRLVVTSNAHDLQANANILQAYIRGINFTGATTSVKLDAGGLPLEALLLQLNKGLATGNACIVELPPEHITVLAQ